MTADSVNELWRDETNPAEKRSILTKACAYAMENEGTESLFYFLIRWIPYHNDFCPDHKINDPFGIFRISDLVDPTNTAASKQDETRSDLVGFSNFWLLLSD